MTASLHKLTAGDGYTYLTDQVARNDAAEMKREGLADYYSSKGESPGRWVGRGVHALNLTDERSVSEAQMRALFGEGLHPDADRIVADAIKAGDDEKAALAKAKLGRRFTDASTKPHPFVIEVSRQYQEWNRAAGNKLDAPVPDEERAAIRTSVGRRLFEKEFGREPMDTRELSGFIAQASRPREQSTAGFDVTFSPVKSVSTLWAIAPREVSESIEQAHNAAIASTLRWIEDEVSYTRRGAGGVRQVDINGLVATQFQHRDSRAGDPDLHTHVAISNKVQATEDGKWLALDGAPLYRATVAASEQYNAALEAELEHRLGVQFEAREQVAGKREVREVAGVSPELMESWSTRRAAIEARARDLAAEFQAAHDRPPTPKELYALHQTATLDTRDAKHEPRSLAEQRQAWRQQATRVLGGEGEVEKMVTASLSVGAVERAEVDVATLAAKVTERVEVDRARYTDVHLLAEARRQLRGHGLAPEELEHTATTVVQVALDDSEIRELSRTDRIREPEALRRADGTSQYVRAHSQLHTSTRVIAAERTVMEAARRVDGRRCSPREVDLAMLEAEANGITLNAGQATLVRELAASGARVQLAMAPAGSGKTTALGVLTRAWQADGGHVIGLGPSAVAAAELGQATGVRADTIAAVTSALADRRRLPDWAAEVGEGSLLIVDEAGMASTADLAALTGWALERGASIRLVGDDQQLSSVAAGGVLRDIQSEVGAVSLDELMRFSDPAEGTATLAVREGRHESLGFYLDRNRVNVTDESLLADAAFDACQADIDAGKDAMMLAYSRALVDDLNGRARQHRIDNLPEDERARLGRSTVLRSGLEASAGDVIVTRANNRRLRISAGDWVKNGDRWTIGAVSEDGSVEAVHQRSHLTVTLPAGYVAESVDLGYASTIHGAQGVTVDITHTILDGTESRQLLYVALSRGRHDNRLHLSIGGDGDEHHRLEEDTVIPKTATDKLLGILDRDGSQRSARTEYREAREPAQILAESAAIYADAIAQAALAEVGTERVAELHAGAERIRAGLTDELAWDNILLPHLAFLELAGEDSLGRLQTAADARPLDGVRDAAAVLDWRLDSRQTQGVGNGPLPWLRGIPPQLGEHEQWGPYLRARADQIDDAATRVRARALALPAGQQPVWAQPLTADRNLLGDVAVWRAATAIPDTEEAPAGPKPPRANEQRYQQTLVKRIGEHEPGSRWVEQVGEQLGGRVVDDGFWPVLGRRLDQAAKAGVDVPATLTEAAAAGPLPDDLPAAALWSRVSPQVAPAIATAHDTNVHRWTPDFTAAVVAALPAGVGDRLLEDAGWAGVVRAVKAAEAHGIPAGDAITDAVALAGGERIGQPGGVSVDELATVLTARLDDLVTGAVSERDHDDAAEAAAPPVAEPPAAETVDVPTYRDADIPPAEDLPPDPLDLEMAAPAGEIVAPADEAEAAPVDDPRRARIVALHEDAAQFYAAAYAGSKAADYIRGRFGTDLSQDSRVSIGYAPAGWTALTDHLTAQGASADELVTAGLAKWSSRGTPIDTFRDRVVVGLRDSRGDLVGFSGRAAPGAGPEVPKYLNTPTTPAFRKGEVLYGLPEQADRLAAGATVVRTEGVFDAIAVSAATEGRAVGVAPMGTALTEVQAEWIAAAAGGRPVLVATDQDTAGRAAAARDHDLLAAQGVDDRRLVLIDPQDPAAAIKDPAEAVQRDGGEAIRRGVDGLEVAPSMTGEVVADKISAVSPDHLGRADVRVQVAREVAPIIAAGPPEQWRDNIDRAAQAMAARSGVDADWCTELVRDEVTAAAGEWQPAAEPSRAADLQHLAATAQATARTQRLAALDRQLDRLTAGRSQTPDRTGSLLDRLERLEQSIDDRADRQRDLEERTTDYYQPEQHRGLDDDGPGLSR